LEAAHNILEGRADISVRPAKSATIANSPLAFIS
jgi:hypothetical protein